MRHKLSTFSDFAATLLPHETARLLSAHAFSDVEKQAILERLHHNCQHIHQPLPFDDRIDKRKYSSLKTWISEYLQKMDADARLEWMSNMEHKIISDAIEPEEERAVLRALREIKPTDYFFVKFYELVQAFRHFLLIRLRHDEHSATNRYIEQHRSAYLRSKQTYEQLHEATLDITRQYATGQGESEQWQQWLTEVFYDETLDGQNRYFALIRLIFVHLNYGRLSTLLEKFDFQDKVFQRGVYYSKRLLRNYYSQRLLLHSKLKDYDTAAYYGYLSIRGKNSDYVFYVNNLAAVLLRTKKYPEALALMKAAYPEAKTTRNLYNKIGFVSFYMRCLICNRQYRNAESYGATFLKAYSKEIFNYRWHLFFTNYLAALFFLGKNARLLGVIRQHALIARDLAYSKTPAYLPFIPWLCDIANYIETGKGMQKLADSVSQHIKALPNDSERLPQVRDFWEDIREKVPELYSLVMARGLGVFFK